MTTTTTTTMMNDDNEDRGGEGGGKGRNASLARLLEATGPGVGEGFVPSPSIRDFLNEKARILVVGAGGLGCELLKDLALMGFGHLHVIDMDTIDLSNLNRQFLFREKDIGKSKAETAARFIMDRVPTCKVTPHVGNLKEKDEDFYRQFNLIVCGLDSIEARRWINSMAISLVAVDDNGNIDSGSIIPIVDGGTEGFKGQARVIIPRVTACFECTLDLFPPRITYQQCTIANTPRLPEHCIAWASQMKWVEEFGDKKRIDGDDPEHVQWIYSQAKQRAEQFKIDGVTLRLTKGVVKNIIPAIASTNAIIAAACAMEAFKICTNSAPYLNNYFMYMGSTSLYTYTFEYERKPGCPVCGSNTKNYTVDPSMTLEELIDLLLADSDLQMKRPSLTTGAKTLYMQAPPPLEAQTRPNLAKPLSSLLQSGESVSVHDPALPFYVNLVVTFRS